MSAEAPPTPELDKRREIINSGAPDVLSEFVQWLDARGIHLASYVTFEGHEQPQLVPIRTGYDELFTDFFEIDRDKIEAESRAVLAAYREATAAQG